MPRLRWVFAFAIVALLAFIVSTACFFELKKITKLQMIIEERSSRLEEKEQAVREYREKIEFYKTKEGIAHLAREQHNLTFPGERVYIIISESEDNAP